MIHGEFFTHLFYFTKGVSKFQIIQKNKRQLEINIIKNEKFTKDELNEILNKIKNKCGKNMKIKIKFVKFIKLTKSGKHKFIISEVKKEF
jgi:phenylacetate-CoA ligase